MCRTRGRGPRAKRPPNGGERMEAVYGSHHNGLRTALLLGLLSALILGVGAIFGNGGLLIALVLAVGLNAFTYFNSDKLALRSMRAYPVTEAEQPRLYAIVQELAARNNMPMPRLYMSPTNQPNA